MAASTFPATTLTNDTGSFAAPNGDGTVLNNALLQTLIANLNSMFAGAGAYTTFTLGGLFKAEGFGTHTFSAGGTGNNNVTVRNTTAGTANYAALFLGNDASASCVQLRALSSTFTTSAFNVQDGALLYVERSGGLSIATADAAGMVRFYTGGTSERMRLSAAGGLSIGTTTDAGVTNLLVAGGIFTNLGGYLATAMDSAGFYMLTWPTTASAANTRVGNGGYAQLVTSLRAIKADIQPIPPTDAIRIVRGLQGVTYRSRIETDDQQRRWPGFIAEDVEAVAPVLAVHDEKGALQSVAYDRVAAYLVPAMQDLDRRLSALEAA